MNKKVNNYKAGQPAEHFFSMTQKINFDLVLNLII